MASSSVSQSLSSSISSSSSSAAAAAALSSSTKLHPIYVALDSHNFAKAIKLCNALPRSHTTAQALLAHALHKSGQIEKALLVLRTLLPVCEELEYAIRRQSPENCNVLESLENPWHLSQNKEWCKLVDKEEDLHKTAIVTDETTLDTLAITLQGLRMYATCYALYGWAAAQHASASAVANNDMLVHCLTKQYLSGLHVLCSPQYHSIMTAPATANSTTDTSSLVEPADTIESSLLASLQVISLQLARLAHKTAWAARTALWQLMWTSKGDDPTTKTRLQLLPRLAESLAKKLMELLPSAENSLLHIEAMRLLDKNEDLLQCLQHLETQPPNDEIMTLTTQQMKQSQAEVLERLERWEHAIDTYLELLQSHPDQWTYWKGIVRCAYRQGGMDLARKVVERVQNDDGKSKYPERARHLIQCELAAVDIRGLDGNTVMGQSDPVDSHDLNTQVLQDAIVEYATIFASRASCTYSDLAPYVELLVHAKERMDMDSFLEWCSQLRRQDSSPSTDRATLRSFLVSVQLSYKVVSMLGENAASNWLPEWTELVQIWQQCRNLGSAPEGEDAQKENQPGDELILLAVQFLLYDSTNTKRLVTTAALLEMALQNSPYNSYLKITAMDVYSRLNAVGRSWELYQELNVKHIQLDSCTYLVLPMLTDGGLFNEVIDVSNSILKLHASTARDSGEFAARAMEHGTLSKANEFLVFQRERMNNSLTLLDAKGRIMDCAPLLFTEHAGKKGSPMLALHHGIMGGVSDMERATKIVMEANNSLGAPHIVTIATKSLPVDSFSDNRDFDILSHQILHRVTPFAKIETVNDSMRRGHLHGLLIRATLCMDVVKGPKKGKVTKPTDALLTRCKSLLDACDRTSHFAEGIVFAAGYRETVDAIVILCRILVFVSSGQPNTAENDTLSSREAHAEQLLSSVINSIRNAQTALNATAVSSVCRFIPDGLAPLFAMLQMTTKLFATFGWGKRKCHTKKSARALRDLALQVKGWVCQMKGTMESLPEDNDDDLVSKASELFQLVENEESVDDAIGNETCQKVSEAQQLTRARIMPILEEMATELESFDIPED